MTAVNESSTVLEQKKLHAGEMVHLESVDSSYALTS